MRPQRFAQGQLNRRTFVGGAMGTAAATILAACGGNPATAIPTATSAATTAAQTVGSTPGGTATPTTAIAATSVTQLPSATPQVSGSAAATSTESPMSGGRLIIADMQGDQSLDPYKTTWHSTAQFLVYTSYVAKGPDLAYIPYIFESWSMSSDAKEWTFKIKPGIKNSDGSLVDAAMIKFIVDRAVDPKLKVNGGQALGPIKQTTVLDPMTVKFMYDTPYPSLLDGLAQREVSSRAAFEKYGDDFANHPAGPGPYIVRQQIPGNQFVYDRNPDYTWPPSFYTNRGPTYLDGVTIKLITEDATMWNALKAGEVHIAPIPTAFIKEAGTTTDLTVIKRLEMGIRYLGMNCAKPPFNDPLTRQAVTHAIDREAIVKNALDGYGEALYTPLPVAAEFSDNAGMKKIGYAYDPAAGREKLKEAGYDLSGAVATKGGQPLEVTLLIPNADFYKRTGQIVQAQLKEIGIKINLQVADGSAIVDATVAGTHQMFLYYYLQNDPRYIMFSFLHSSRIKATNRAWYASPALDTLIEQGQVEPDRIKAQAIYAKAQEMVVQAAPWVPIANVYSFTGVRKEVRGFQVHPQGLYPQPGYLLHDTWLAKK